MARRRAPRAERWPTTAPPATKLQAQAKAQVQVQAPHERPTAAWTAPRSRARSQRQAAPSTALRPKHLPADPAVASLATPAQAREESSRPRSASGSPPAAVGCSCRDLVPLDRIAAPRV